MARIAQNYPLKQWDATFDKHRLPPGQHCIDLYHVYDNLSQTPYIPGRGIECGDPNTYLMRAQHVITPKAMLEHLDWSNNNPTQFISLFGNKAHAHREMARRKSQLFSREQANGTRQRRDPRSVHIAHVRIYRDSKVWYFSRDEMLAMMEMFGGMACFDAMKTSKASEWFVWGVVPDDHVVKII